MLHRFDSVYQGIDGHPVEVIESCFKFIRSQGYDIVSVQDAIERSASGDRLKRPMVAFTVDDGFRDQYEVGVELFVKYDVPATFFITTSLIENNDWLWDTRIQYLVNNCNKEEDIKRVCAEFKVSSVTRREIAEELILGFKYLGESEINRNITRLCEYLNLEIPDKPGVEYSYMTWDDVNSLESKGLSVGPHTRSHKILSTIDGDMARQEILGSWEDLKRKTERPAPVFCYPMGKYRDYEQKDINILNQSEMIAAVTAEPGALRLGGNNDVYQLPRYGMPDSIIDFRQYATWIEEYKNLSVWR